MFAELIRAINLYVLNEQIKSYWSMELKPIPWCQERKDLDELVVRFD